MLLVILGLKPDRGFIAACPEFPSASAEAADEKEVLQEMERQLDRALAADVAAKLQAGFGRDCSGCGKLFLPRIILRQAPLFCPSCREEAMAKSPGETAGTGGTRDMAYFLKAAGVPPSHLYCSFDNYRGPLPARRPAFLHGPVGSGKTHLAVAYLREAVVDRDKPVKFTRSLDLIRALRDCFGGKTGRFSSEVLDQAKTPHFLVLDDMGKEAQSSFVAEALFDLIDYRHVHGLPTLITSNLHLKEFSERYGSDFAEGIASRIVAMGGTYELKGKDQRLWKN